MHYIHLLRAPRVAGPPVRPHLELLFTIATDLRDALVVPDGPLHVCVTAHLDGAARLLTRKGDLVWKPHTRVLKPRVGLPADLARAVAAGQDVVICVAVEGLASAESAWRVLNSSRDDTESRGLVMPAWAALGAGPDVSTRRLALSPTLPAAYVEVEEEYGEGSLARHVWDGGVVALCAIAGAAAHHKTPEAARRRRPGDGVRAVVEVLAGEAPANILELGCGVGVLGIGIASVRRHLLDSSAPCHVLMTDLDEAEERVVANMARFTKAASVEAKVHDQQAPAAGATNDETEKEKQQEETNEGELSYENLDWEDARRGKLPPLAASRAWDLVVVSDCTYNVDVLPALVDTLSTLHEHNKSKATCNDGSTGKANVVAGEAATDSSIGKTHESARGGNRVTRVFLATKPRHEDEAVFFELMSAQGWRPAAEVERLPVPMLGKDAEAQMVELYLFEKGGTGSPSLGDGGLSVARLSLSGGGNGRA